MSVDLTTAIEDPLQLQLLSEQTIEDVILVAYGADRSMARPTATWRSAR